MLWIADRLQTLTGTTDTPETLQAWLNGADWIIGKRLPEDGRTPHAGLLPAGFSAEHLGPNDHYYWDNFWS